jgi:tetratricopeptide (TPR) repeat protein
MAPRTPSIAIVDVAAPEADMNRRDQVVAQAWQAFSRSTRVKTVSQLAIQKWREREARAQETPTASEELRDARKLLAEGKKAYQALKFNVAVESLSEARREFILKLPSLRANRDLLDAHLYLGLTYVALKQISKAEEEFRRVVYLDPLRELSAKEFSPKVLEVFGKVRRDVLAEEPISVRLESRPAGALAYLNGRSIGKTPIEAKLQPGEYFVLMELKGFDPWYKPIRLKKRRESLSATLQPTGSSLNLSRDFRVREGADAESGDFGPLVDLASAVGADYVFLGTVDRKRDYRLLGQLFDARTSELSQVAVLSGSPEFESMPASTPDMVDTLLGFIRPDGKLISAEGNAADLNYRSEDLTVGGADRPPQDTVAPVPPKKWYQRWWIYPLIAGSGVGIYFGAKKIGNTGGSKIVIDNRGNF